MELFAKTFSEPFNLAITIAEINKTANTYGCVISYGGLLDQFSQRSVYSITHDIGFTKEQVLTEIVDVLQHSQTSGREIVLHALSEQEYIKTVGPVLTDEIIKKIMDSLRKNEKVETFSDDWRYYWESIFPGWHKKYGLTEKNLDYYERLLTAKKIDFVREENKLSVVLDKTEASGFQINLELVIEKCEYKYYGYCTGSGDDLFQVHPDLALSAFETHKSVHFSQAEVD